jgi:hypothetical protein
MSIIIHINAQKGHQIKKGQIRNQSKHKVCVTQTKNTGEEKSWLEYNLNCFEKKIFFLTKYNKI